MGRPLSEDLRERIVAAVEAGASRREAAERFSVSASCAVKLLQRWRRTGSVAPGQIGGQKRHALAEHDGAVRALVAAAPDATLAELRAGLAARGIRVGRTSVRPLPARDRADAQKKTLHAAEQDRPDVAAARARWQRSSSAS